MPNSPWPIRASRNKREKTQVRLLPHLGGWQAAKTTVAAGYLPTKLHISQPKCKENRLHPACLAHCRGWKCRLRPPQPPGGAEENEAYASSPCRGPTKKKAPPKLRRTNTMQQNEKNEQVGRQEDAREMDTCPRLCSAFFRISVKICVKASSGTAEYVSDSNDHRNGAKE